MPAGSTYTPIATTTLGSAVASYTFSSIAGTYTDLILVFNGSTTVDNDGYYVRVNSDTGTNYSVTSLSGNGSTAGSSRQTSQTSSLVGFNSSSTSPDVITVSFQNYANTTTYKTFLSRLASPARATAANVGLWRSTSAITSITLGGASSNLASGGTLTLYGIASA